MVKRTARCLSLTAFVAWPCYLVGAPAPTAALAPITIAKDTTYITEPLTPDGRPDYCAWLNRKYGAGVTPENNAAVLLIGLMPDSLAPEILSRMGFDPKRPSARPGWIGGPFRKPDQTPELRKILESRLTSTEPRPAGLSEIPPDLAHAFRQQWQRAQSGPWSASDCPLIAVWLDANAAGLELAGAAASRPRYWIPVQGSPSAMRYPSLLYCREIAIALRMRALLHVGSNRRGQAVDDLLTGLRLGRLLGQGVRAIERLSGIAVSGTVLEALPPALGQGAMSLADLRRLRDGLLRLPAARSPDEAFDESERFGSLDAVLDIHSAARRGQMTEWLRRAAREGGRLPKAAFRVPADAVDWNEALRIINRVVDGQDVLEKYKDDTAWTTAVVPWIEGAEKNPALRRDLTRALLAVPLYSKGLSGWWPLFGVRAREGRAPMAWNEVEAEYRLAVAATIAALQRAEAGAYPRSVGQLEGERDGYVVQARGDADAGHFALTAVPKVRGETGWRAFCVDDSGRMLIVHDDWGAPAVEAGRCPAATAGKAPTADSPRAAATPRTARILIAAPAATGFLVAVSLLLSLAVRSGRSPVGWRRPLGALTLLGLWGTSTVLGALARDVPSLARIALTYAVALVSLTLALFVWRGAAWARRVLVALCLCGLGLVGVWILYELVWDPSARLGSLAVAAGVGTPLAFMLAVLFHREVASDFGTPAATEQPEPSITESAFGRRVSSVGWSRLIAGFSLAAALAVVAGLSAAFLQDAADVSAKPVPAVLWAFLVVALVAIPASVAASRGAEWARRVLVVGWGGVLVLAVLVACAIAAAERLGALGVRLGFAALLVWLPMFVWTVVSHADVARGFLHTRQESGRDKRAHRFAPAIPAAVTVLGLLLLACLMQVMRHGAERRLLDEHIEAARRDVQNLEVTAGKLPEFQAEVTQLEDRLGALRRIVPEQLDVAPFMTTLEELGREGGIGVTTWTGKRFSSEALESIDVELQLKGTPAQIERFASRVHALARLAAWRTRQMETGGATATVRIYAMATPAPKPTTSQCSTPKSHVWFWPYAADVRGRQEALQRICGRLQRLDVVRRQVDAYQVQRGLSERLSQIVQRLQAERPPTRAAPPASEATPRSGSRRPLRRIRRTVVRT
jgi:Tfp pilus assembly protein PilO